MAQGLPIDSQCADGLVCRGGQCIAVTCTVSADCELGAPYCTGDDQRLCSDTCTADLQCPGFGEDVAQEFCEAGRCVTCRAGMNDCADTEVCDEGTCRACVRHTECATGVCEAGACVSETVVAFTDPTGSASSDCTLAQPCSLSRALALSPARKYVVLAAGTYQETSTHDIAGNQWLIGRGTAETTVARGSGDLFSVSDPESSLSLEGLTMTAAASAVYCAGNAEGFPKLRVRDAEIRGSGSAISARECEIEVDRATLIENTDGIHLNNPVAGSVTNSMLVRNGQAVFLQTNTVGASFPSFGFNTIVDNGTGLSCSGGSATSVSAPNNIIVRNTVDTSGPCSLSLTGSIVGADIATLMFKSPDAAPYDYHLLSGSVAIDAATGTSPPHDFDGELRPKGAAADVGADEAQ
jgi:hypothetical protein